MDWPDVQAALHVIQLAKDHPKLQPLAQKAMAELEKESETLKQGLPQEVGREIEQQRKEEEAGNGT